MNFRIVLVCLVFILYFFDEISSQQELNNQEECIDGPSMWYTGRRNVTSSGIACQRWDSNFPHAPKQTPSDGSHHNYCRNPDGDLKGTWCYTMDPTKRWEYCKIKKCPDDSVVIWTNHDSKNGGAHILSVKADPEIVKLQTDTVGIFNVSVLVASNQTKTEFWAVTADYNRQMIFFTDYMSEYIGVRYMDLGITAQFLEGMAHGIENMAYDWLTGNLYWTDSEFKWVMAVDRTFSFYTPVYRTKLDPPYAIALHAKQRKLFFSIYNSAGAVIVTTDLAGKGERILFASPEVYDVTGLTIDYTDDRLYWTDFTGYGGKVVSSRLDGTNKTVHHGRSGAIYWGISAYLDYLYVTDVHARYSPAGDKHYSVWVINKLPKVESVFRYTLEGKPRGISILSKNEDRSFDDVSAEGECLNQPACDHICLPRINATRECACTLGYTKVGDTRCVTNVVQDNFLLLADAGQGKVFQIPFNITSTNQYSVIPLRKTKKVATIAIDPHTKNIYWSDKRVETIKKAGLDGSRTYPLLKQHAVSMAVDHRDGNVFFADEESQTISVTTSSGTHTRVLMQPDNFNETDIKMLTLDPKNNALYWTDAGSGIGNGSVWRMRMDGSRKEMVYNKLHSPQAITIDYKRNSLFIGEAKTGMVYEKPLDELKTIQNTSHLNAKQFDLSGHIRRLTFYIADIKVHENTLFFVDGKTNKIEQIDLTSGPASLTTYGPSEFYRITSLALFSTSYYDTYLRPIPNPCATQNHPCQHICIPVSNTTKRCLCEGGSVQLGSACYKTANSGKAPRYKEGTCPIDKTYSLLPCFSEAEVTWTDPVWTDDKTDASALTLTRPQWKSPANFSVGTYVFSYTATDSDKNVARCTFNVYVKATSCGDPPLMPPSLMINGRLPCNYNFGAEYDVKCVEPNTKIVFQGSSGDDVTNICTRSGNWSIPDFKSARCRPKPTTAPGTATTTTTATTANTEKEQPHTKKIHTISPTLSDSNTKGVGGIVAPQSTGLKPGTVAAIVVMAILLVIIIAAVVIMTLRNRPIWKVARFEFPILWKSKTEESPPSENPYSVMS
uniref:Low-density lipoprotein receptor-related protein 6-like n=1 Tax=Phallusia mammillata TaxID=59560 RepID=A0A6F9DJ78_9ASCI|nr:low-density lipoprotein receptor-related protein 6-like [Phallusia mammillata]